MIRLWLTILIAAAIAVAFGDGTRRLALMQGSGGIGRLCSWRCGGDDMPAPLVCRLENTALRVHSTRLVIIVYRLASRVTQGGIDGGLASRVAGGGIGRGAGVAWLESANWRLAWIMGAGIIGGSAMCVGRGSLLNQRLVSGNRCLLANLMRPSVIGTPICGFPIVVIG